MQARKKENRKRTEKGKAFAKHENEQKVIVR